MGSEERFLTPFPGSRGAGGSRGRVPSGLFLCAGAVVWRFSSENDVQFSTRSRRCPNGIPQVTQRDPTGAQGTPKGSHRSPKTTKGTLKDGQRMVDGWMMDGWMYGWMDGWWMDGGWMDGCIKLGFQKIRNKKGTVFWNPQISPIHQVFKRFWA